MHCPRTPDAHDVASSDRELSLVQSISPMASSSRLLNLPWESRSFIYYYALHSATQPIRINNKQDLRFLAKCVYANRTVHFPDVMEEAVKSSRASAPSGKLGFLRVCRQIYLEGVPIFYQSNHFVVSHSYLQKTYWGWESHSWGRLYRISLASNFLPWLEALPTPCISVLRNIMIALHSESMT